MHISGNSTKFSIVVPTRNRGKYLYHCLKTCLNQNYDNYEIIVSDNCSEDNTKEVVDGFGNDKIKYYKTPKPMAMTSNYNFILEKATGDYIIYLGDDDGLHFHALNTLNRVIQTSNFKVITWKTNEYSWPDCANSHQRNTHVLYFSEDSMVLDSKALMRTVLKYKAKHTVLPMLYMKSAIHKSVIQKIKKKNGIMFDSQSPDAYSCFAISFTVEKFLYLGTPLSIAGSGGGSTGGNVIYRKDNNASKDYMKMNKKDKKDFKSSIFSEEILGIARGSAIYFEDSFNIFKLNHGLGESWQTNIFNMITRICNEEFTYLEVIKKMDDRKKEYENFRNVILSQLKDYPLYLLWAKFLLSGSPYQSIPYVGEHRRNVTNKEFRVIYDKTISNIYEACEFTAKKMNYEERLLIQEKITKNNLFQGYLFALKLMLRPVVPHRKGFYYLERIVNRFF